MKQKTAAKLKYRIGICLTGTHRELLQKLETAKEITTGLWLSPRKLMTVVMVVLTGFDTNYCGLL